MLSTGLLHWLTSDQGLMALLAQNWLLGITLIALVIFLETGLIVLPFLPGDSLLFATGAFLGVSGISPIIPMVMIATAAIAGDSVNYALGRSWLGQWIIHRGLIKPHHLDKTREYFATLGGPTVTLGRFIPVVRTVAPFFAGLSGMHPRRFMLFNALGGVIWTGSLMLAGVWLCRISWVREHLSLFSLAVVVISVLPMLLHLLPRMWKQAQVG